MTASAFWATMELNRNHWGNSYALIDGAGAGMSLWPLQSEDVEPWYDDACLLKDAPGVYYLYSGGGGKSTGSHRRRYCTSARPSRSTASRASPSSTS